ncbi:MAG: DUF3301 domain-containing protein [Chromatiaceae bacterium]|nr:MAG: DUF3301 domain-containing protein [Chromatiaceae bacterium]
MSNLFALLLLLLLGWFWLDSLRARETALVLARRACEARDLQFLDQAVALRRLGVRWTAAGLRLRRVYRFEFSEEGLVRRTGYLVLVGLRLTELSLGLPAAAADA